MLNHHEFLAKVHQTHRNVGVWKDDNPNAGDCPDERIIFYFEVLNQLNLLRPGVRLLDLAGGLAWFSPMAREIGLETILVDDFGGGGGVDIKFREEALQVLARFSKRGIEVHELDFFKSPLPVATDSMDVITCFHSLEHWHNSPKALFKEIRRILKPGGILFIATPNAVNLRKRAFVLFGKTNFPRLEEWYEEPVWRGHVREPVIADLHALMKWNGFDVVSTYGRNFIGRDSKALAFLPTEIRHKLGKYSQTILQHFPSLCSDIHVVGRKS